MQAPQVNPCVHGGRETTLTSDRRRLIARIRGRQTVRSKPDSILGQAGDRRVHCDRQDTKKMDDPGPKYIPCRNGRGLNTTRLASD